MITANNYLEQSINLDWSKMPAVLKKGKPDVDDAIEFYNDDDDIKETIDIFLKQVNDNLSEKSKEKKESKPAPKKAAVNKPKFKDTDEVSISSYNTTGIIDGEAELNEEKSIYSYVVVFADGDNEMIEESALKKIDKSKEKKESKPAPKAAVNKPKPQVKIVDARKQEFEDGTILRGQKINGTDIRLVVKGTKVQFVIDGKGRAIGSYEDMNVKYDNHLEVLKENKETPCDEKLEDLRKEFTKKPSKPRAKKTLSSKMRDTTVDAYAKEFVLVRRFYNMIGKKNTTFRKIQLLYRAYQKAILTKEVSKSNVRNAVLFNTINEKVVKMYKVAVDNGNSDAKEVVIEDEVLISQMKTLMETTTLNPAVTLSKSYVSLSKQPEVAKVKRLLNRFNKAIDADIIDKDNRLWSVIKSERKELMSYLEDPTDEIEVKVYGLAAPKVQPIKEYKFPKTVKKKVETKGMANPIVIQSRKVIEQPLFMVKKVEDFDIKEMPLIESKKESNDCFFNEGVKKVETKPTVKEVDLRNLGFTKAVDAPDTPDGLFRLPGAIGEFLQDLQSYQALILIKGTKHTSKSQLAMQIANALGESGKKVGYIDYEQGGVNSKDTIDSLGWNTTPEGKENIHIKGELENPMKELRSFCKHFFAIVADSVTDLGIKPDQLSQLRKEFPNCIWIFISQVKENGSMYGGNKMAHNPTVIIECFPHHDPKFRYATLEKNRGNKLNKYYSMYYKKLITNPNDVPIEELEDNEVIKTVYL